MADGVILTAEATSKVAGSIISSTKNFIVNVRDAPKELKAVHIEVSTLRAALDSLQLLSDPAGTNFQGVPQLKDAVSSAGDILDDIEKLLPKEKDANPRVQWALVAKKAQAYLDKLRPCKATIDLALSAYTSNQIAEVSKGVADMKVQLDQVAQSQITEQERNVLDWLSPISYAQEQDDLTSMYQDGTFGDLIRSPQFRNWKAPTSTNNRALFCSGIQGAGKTIFSSAVVDVLTQEADTAGGGLPVGIIYLYCNFKRRHEQTTGGLLSNVLKQLALCLRKVPLSVKSIHATHSMRGSRPRTDTLMGEIVTLISEFDHVSLVVDALDELDPETLDEFLPLLTKLAEISNFRLLATARPVPDVAAVFKDIGALELEIKPSQADLEMYIRAQIPPRFAQENVATGIVDKLLDVADGMFLLVRLHLNQLKSQRTQARLRKVLETLGSGSQGCKQAYDDTMERIDSQDEASRELAHQIIWWTACSKRYLKVEELQHAIALFDNQPRFKPSDVTEVSDMLAVCAGLVVLDEGTQVIRLVHKTAQEYLDAVGAEPTDSAASRIAIENRACWADICVRSLLADDFRTGPCKSDVEMALRLTRNPLLKYSSANWGHHFLEFEKVEPVWTSCRKFLTSLHSVQASVQAASLPSHREEGWSQEYPRATNALWLCAHFDLAKTIVWLLDGEYAASLFLIGAEALREAARSNSQTVMEVLLSSGVKHNGDAYGVTPMHEAARRGYSECMQKLKLSGVDIDVETSSKRTPLHDACSNGHLETVSLLLTMGADVNVQSEPSKWTPLHGAITSGNEELVKLLLSHHADLSSKSSDGESPLHIAAVANKPDICSVLLDHGANPSEQDCQGDTPVHVAARNGYHKLLTVLTERGADIQARNLSGATALHIASEKNDTEAMLQLFAVGANPTISNYIGAHPIHLAAGMGYLEAVKLLLQNGADIDARYESKYFKKRVGNREWYSIRLVKPQNFVTALYVAERGGKTGVFDFLTQENAQVFEVDETEEKGYVGERPLVRLYFSEFQENLPPNWDKIRGAVQRLQLELNDWLASPMPGITWGPQGPDSLLKFTATIRGPEETPYSDGLFVIDLVYPSDYPFKPPRTTMTTRIYHPNINSYGAICLDILRDQ